MLTLWRTGGVPSLEIKTGPLWLSDIKINYQFNIFSPEYNNSNDKFWRRLYAQLPQPQAPSTLCEKFPFYSLIFQNSSSRNRSRRPIHMNNVTLFNSNNVA